MESLRRFFCFIGGYIAINQYKDGKGVNDYKKGNRTRTGRNPAPAIQINKQIGEDVARYKEIAEDRCNNKCQGKADSNCNISVHFITFLSIYLSLYLFLVSKKVLTISLSSKGIFSSPIC